MLSRALSLAKGNIPPGSLFDKLRARLHGSLSTCPELVEGQHPRGLLFDKLRAWLHGSCRRALSLSKGNIPRFAFRQAQSADARETAHVP
ncbi:hypothetical protein GCM10009841_02500 [Microlunatus panaciterrae]